MPSGSIDPNCDYLAEFASKRNAIWQNISQAREDGSAVQELLLSELREFTSEDVDIVVFGSLARREWTNGSDVDWTMLVDGQANTEHRATAREIERKLAETTFQGASLKQPGAEGIFGSMAFSHTIVHHIGGQADTNRNTTQRVLLLLEACALRANNQEGPFDRIVKQILNRYLISDSNFHSQTDQQSRIPRFLLNDIVRFWRTMCVDFAYKDWEQAGKKWAIRNIKLRTSRKLLFVAGLQMVFSCYKNESLQRIDYPSNYALQLQRHLMNFVRSTPLNILTWTLLDLKLNDDCALFLDDYDQFLSKINEPTLRNHLENLSESAVYTDKQFLECRAISHRLQSTLKKVCFEVESPLREFICEYGLF